MFNLSAILKFSNSDVKEMAKNAVDNHKDQIASGKDFKNTAFQGYSDRYAKRKKSGKKQPVTLRDTGKMLNAFNVVRTVVKKNQEIQFLYGIKKNKQGTKLFNHNEGEGKMPTRSIAENQELGDKVEEGIVKDFANIIGKNLSRMSKTHVKVTT
tara:strand:- start:375 stop:836 length:462 start_codon:yes stop_codon:yes gene_type:complete